MNALDEFVLFCFIDLQRLAFRLPKMIQLIFKMEKLDFTIIFQFKVFLQDNI